MIQGKQRTERKLWTGLCQMTVLGFNPTADQIAEWTGWDNPREPSYQGEDRDGNPQLRVDVWLKSADELDGQHLITNVAYFISDSERPESSTGKYQYINKKGQTTWVPTKDTVDNISDKVKKYFDISAEPRRTMIGEEDIYNFILAWTNVNTNDKGTKVHLDTPWGEIVTGDVKDLNALVGQFSGVKALLGIRTSSEGKEYQDAFRKVILPFKATRVSRLKSQATGDYPWTSNFQDSFELQVYVEGAGGTSAHQNETTEAEVNAMIDV
jgi:hypothetical protein